MPLLGIFPQKATASINDQWERDGSRKYIAAFTPDCDEVYARDNLGPAYKINYPHPSDPGMVISNIALDQGEDQSRYCDPLHPDDMTVANFGEPCYWWSVDVTYSA